MSGRRAHDSARRLDLNEVRQFLSEGHDLDFAALHFRAFRRDLSRALWNAEARAPQERSA